MQEKVQTLPQIKNAVVLQKQLSQIMLTSALKQLYLTDICLEMLPFFVALENSETDDSSSYYYNLYHYAGNNPVKYTDPNGMWKDNGDGTFTAQKDDTLWGLQQETGKDWHESNWKDGRDPRTLQVGEKIDMGIHSEKPDNAPEINNNSEAEKLYNEGSGQTAWLGNDVFNAIRKANASKADKIRSGNTTLADGNYRIQLSSNNWLFGKNSRWDKSGLFFMGGTKIDYKISTGTKFCIVDFTASEGDGFWDIYDVTNKSKNADGIGPNCERKGSHPYAFYSRSWSISFPVPSGKKW